MSNSHVRGKDQTRLAYGARLYMSSRRYALKYSIQDIYLGKGIVTALYEVVNESGMASAFHGCRPAAQCTIWEGANASQSMLIIYVMYIG